MLMGADPNDYDVVTSARPEQVEALFERTILLGKQFGVVTVVVDGQGFDVATFRREWGYEDGRRPGGVAYSDAAEDAARRDFTINGMFYDPLADEVIDHVGGREDLERALVRCIGRPEERFREDHLRIMRAVRFAARLDFEIECETHQAIKSLAPLAAQVAAERLSDELEIILTDRAPARALRLMDELGILFEVLPELRETKGCEQPKNFHPEGDVFVHTMLTVDKLGPYPDFETALAALLHDIGKPKASSIAGALQFANHTEYGAEMARDVCRRLRLPNKVTERVCWLVGRHLYFKDARKMKESTLRKLFSEPGFEQLAELIKADALASWGNLEDYDYVIEKRGGLAEEEIRPPRLVTGHDLIAMGHKPGPAFREILDEIRNKQLEGTLRDRAAALRLAAKLAELRECDKSES